MVYSVFPKTHAGFSIFGIETIGWGCIAERYSDCSHIWELPTADVLSSKIGQESWWFMSPLG